jgi:hypothetical protein
VQIEQEGAHARLDAGWLKVVDQEKWSPVTRIDEITDDNMAQIPSGTRGQDVLDVALCRLDILVIGVVQ